MRLPPWALLLWLPFITILAGEIEYRAGNVWVNEPICLAPGISWLIGILLMLTGRPRTKEGTQRLHSRMAWIIVAYALALGVINPMLWFPGSLHECRAYITTPLLPVRPTIRVNNICRKDAEWLCVVFMAPLAWAGVTGSARGEWLQSIGAWLVLFGQFFALNYNVSHATSGITCWYRWGVLLTAPPVLSR